MIIRPAKKHASFCEESWRWHASTHCLPRTAICLVFEGPSSKQYMTIHVGNLFPSFLRGKNIFIICSHSQGCVFSRFFFWQWLVPTFQHDFSFPLPGDPFQHLLVRFHGAYPPAACPVCWKWTARCYGNWELYMMLAAEDMGPALVFACDSDDSA